jgi:pseudouridylate synthase
VNTNLAPSPEVLRALQQNKPVVALESTLITHGLPYPINRETALNMERAVRENGAVPATIAIINGSIRVGITEQDIETLAQAPAGTVRKCSRRDLPIAVGLQENAATTVAGTMIVANMAGIQVFATGGIGGVHRGHPFDVSADLIELGRTPVAVVCSGAKSLLDLPLTMEVLETQGVPVVGIGTDMLPAFYSRSSDLGVDVRVESPHQAAQIIRASQALQARHGILVVVPVPAEQAFDANEAEAAIAQATREADEQNVQGKLVTPFVLKRVAEITGGKAMTANQALLINNAIVAAQIAVALLTP